MAAKPKHKFVNIRAYVNLYGFFKREVKNGNIISRKAMLPIIKHTIKIYSIYQFDIIRDMIKFGYLRPINRDNYELLHIPIESGSQIDSLGNPLWLF